MRKFFSLLTVLSSLKIFFIYKSGFSFFRRKKSRLKERSVARLPFSRRKFQ